MYLTENLLFATLLVGALLPLVGVALRSSRWRVHVLGLGIVALVLGAATVRRPAEDVVLARALPAPTEQDGMLSSSSCRGCHPGQYASWHASFHRTMTQPARPNTVVAPFDGRRLEGREPEVFGDGVIASGGPLARE